MSFSEAIIIQRAASASAIAEARTLFQEYAQETGLNLDFQNFESELASLPGAYAPPRGALLLAYAAGRAIGCCGMRPLETGICEMKRLYIEPEFRGKGIGRQLAEHVISLARNQGYESMRLDTLRTMGSALGLYARLGFKEIPAYYENPLEEVVYLELRLGCRQA